MKAMINSENEAAIGALLQAYTDAIRAKDARATVALYARDAIAYDLAPPLSLEARSVRDPSYIQQWFDTWEGPIVSEGRDLRIETSADIAYAFCLRHMTGVKRSGEQVDLWFRATMCLRREDGAWRITHVHNSVPFAMDGSDRALLDLQP